MKYNITINRIALLVTLGCIQISITGCSQVKNLMDSFSKNNDIEDASPQTVEELRVTYIQGDMGALEELIAIYQDESQQLDVRKSAVRAMAETQHPIALKALAEFVKNAAAINVELMVTSVSILSEFEEDPVASGALMESIFAVDEKLRAVQAATFKSLKNVNLRIK